MIATILALVTFTIPFPDSLPGGVTYQGQPVTLTIHRRWQSDFINACPHWSSPGWWQYCWPIVKRQALSNRGRFTRRTLAPGTRVTIDLPYGFYQAQINSGPLGPVFTIAP